jgi:Mn-dependent DtxR family transcriptional regulator
MKKTFTPYEFSKTELEILRDLTRSSASISELANHIGKSQPMATAAVENLQEKGFVATERSGMRKMVGFSQAKHAQLLKELFLTYSHVPWESILADSRILPLLKLEHVTPDSVSRATEWRAMRNLMAHGIIINKAQGRTVNPRFHKISEFIREFVSFANSKLAAQVSESAAIVWASGAQFIIRVAAGTAISDKRFKPTATTALATYGIRLISDLEYFYFSPVKRALRPEDIVLHTILIDGVTNVTYALVLMAKVKTDPDSLLTEAEKVGLRSQVEGMLHFLASHEPQNGTVLPRWSEFADKARDYGVRI